MQRRIWTALALAAAMALGHLASAEAATAPAPGQPTLAQVVDRYIAWRGGAAFRKGLKSLHEKVGIRMFGLDGVGEAWQTDDHWRVEVTMPAIRQVTVVTPNGSWVTNVDGQVKAAPDLYRYTRRDPASADAVLGKKGASATLAASQTLNGRTWQVVRVTFGDADTYDDLIDGQTGELYATHSVVKGQPTDAYYSDWRMADGVRTPFATRTVTTDGDEQVQTIQSYETNPKIDPARFTRPPPAHRLVFAPGQTSTGWIPFTGSEIGRIYLQVSVNGHPVRAIFDSGAAASDLDTRLAASFALTPVGAAPMHGENGIGSGSLIGGVDISLGDATLKGVTVTAMDLQGTGADFTAVLGDEVLYESVVDIDFPNQRLALRDPAGFKPPPGAVAIDTVSEDGWQLLPISIEGGPPGLFILDTGLPPTLRMAPAYVKAHGLLAGKPSITIAMGAVGGQASGQYASLKTVRLGGEALANVPALFSDAWPAASFTDQVAGLVGVGILGRFRVMIDWSRSKVWLVPTADSVSAPFARDRLGLGLAPEGQSLRIAAVAPGSPAQTAGLKPGDLIDAVNGGSAAGQIGLGGGAAGTQVTLTLHGAAGAAARTVAVTLADYY